MFLLTLGRTIIFPLYLTLPWQRHNYKQVWPKSSFQHFSYFSQFFGTEFQTIFKRFSNDLFIFTLHKPAGLFLHQLALFCDFIRKR